MKKHRHITHATRYNPGYTQPAPPVSKRTGKFPGNQPFRKPRG